MTYFGFLAIFLVIPIVSLAFLVKRDRHRGLPAVRTLPFWAIFLHVIIAVVYTTPWDNYLVATGVWYYDPDLVTGIVLGWVPIEEYTFFVLQPIMVGLWLALWIAKIPLPEEDKPLSQPFRWSTFAVTAVIWAAGTWLLFSGSEPGTYLGLELAWALPPMLLQLGFGGDILRKHWRLVLLGIVVPTVYLSAADFLAIGWGTWTIDPAQSTGLMVGGVLPIEEVIFFLVTNSLVTLGLVLVWAPESRERLGRIRAALAG